MKYRSQAYCIPAVFLVLLVLVCLGVANNYEWDETRSLYLLSGVGQAMAAILALSFTLVLVGGQLASQYSPRLLADILDREAAVLAAFLGLSAVLPFWLISAFPPSWFTSVVPLSWFNVPSTGAVFLALTMASAAIVWLVFYLLRLPARLSPEVRIRGLGDQAVTQIEAGAVSEPEGVKALESCLLRSIGTQDFDTYRDALRQMTRILQTGSAHRDSNGHSPLAADLLHRLEGDLSIAATTWAFRRPTSDVFASAFAEIVNLRDVALGHEVSQMFSRLNAELAVRQHTVAAADFTVLLGTLGGQAAKAGWNDFAVSIIKELAPHTLLGMRERQPAFFTYLVEALAHVAEGALGSSTSDGTGDRRAYVCISLSEGLSVVLETLAAVESESHWTAGSRPGPASRNANLPSYQAEGKCLFEIGAASLDLGWADDADFIAYAIADLEARVDTQLHIVAESISDSGVSRSQYLSKVPIGAQSLAQFGRIVQGYRESRVDSDKVV